MTCTFLIPVKYDTPDRAVNLRLTTSYLTKHFPGCPILIGEQGGTYFSDYPNYTHFDYPNFHRTKMLNDLCRQAATDVVVNYDADVLFPPHQLADAINRCEHGVDFCYPYSGDFCLVPRPMWVPVLLRSLDVTPLASARLTTRISSVGGAVVCNRQSWWQYGGENERMVSYAPEDVERWERWLRLGAKVERVPGKLYHIQHRRGPDSWVKHPYWADNNRELEKERGMSAEELREYVRGWAWMQ